MNDLEAVPGMRLFKRANGYWYADLDRNVRISLKTKEKAQARRLFRILKQKYLADKLLILEGRLPIINLGDFADEYIEYSFKSKARFTYQTDGVAWRQLLRSFPPHTHLSRLDPKSLERWLLNLKVKPTSANVWYRHLKAAFTKAVEWGYLKTNPFRLIKPLRVSEKLPRYLTPEDIELLLSAESDPNFRLLWEFLLASGLRRSEALQIKAPINWQSRRLIIRGKGNRERALAITPHLEAILRRHPVQVGQLWPWKPDSVSQHFRKTARKAGIKARLHDLRHTYASNLAMAGVDTRVVQRILGHQDYKTTQRYEHLTPEFIEQQIADKLRTRKNQD